MLTSKSHRILFFIIVLILSLITVMLGIFISTTGPRVRLVSSNINLETDHLTRNATITLHFDRPIQKKDYSNSISIEPAVEANINASNQSLLITLNENLRSETDYSITLKPDVRGSDGKSMHKAFTYSFTTHKPTFAYLVRNDGKAPERNDNPMGAFYDDDLESRRRRVVQTEATVDDTIYKSDVEGEKEELFSAPIIYDFAISQDHLFVSIHDDKYGFVHVERSTGRETDIPLPIKKNVKVETNARIKNMVTAPRGDQVLFTLGLNPSEVSPAIYKYYSDALYLYDTKSMQTEVFSGGKKSEPLKALSIELSEDGQLALINDELQMFSVLSSFNDAEPANLGAYDIAGGFSPDSTKVLLYDGNQSQIYDAKTSKLQAIQLEQPGYRAQFKSNSSNLFIPIEIYNYTKSNSKLFEYDLNTKQSRLIWKGSDRVQTIESSFDDRLVAIELIPSNCTFDNLEFSGQCQEIETIIIDSISGNEKLRFKGFSPVWLP